MFVPNGDSVSGPVWKPISNRASGVKTRGSPEGGEQIPPSRVTLALSTLRRYCKAFAKALASVVSAQYYRNIHALLSIICCLSRADFRFSRLFLEP